MNELEIAKHMACDIVISADASC